MTINCKHKIKIPAIDFVMAGNFPITNAYYFRPGGEMSLFRYGDKYSDVWDIAVGFPVNSSYVNIANYVSEFLENNAYRFDNESDKNKIIVYKQDNMGWVQKKMISGLNKIGFDLNKPDVAEYIIRFSPKESEVSVIFPDLFNEKDCSYIRTYGHNNLLYALNKALVRIDSHGNKIDEFLGKLYNDCFADRHGCIDLEMKWNGTYGL